MKNTCSQCGIVFHGDKRKRCIDCRLRLNGQVSRIKPVKPKPKFIPAPGKSYMDILTENMERKYPGKGKQKALESIKRSRLAYSWGGQ